MNQLSDRDRAEILALVRDYGAAWDAADAEGFAALFTRDAICAFFRDDAERPAVVLEGHQALGDAVVARAGRFRDIGLTTMHVMTDTTLDLLADGRVSARTGVRVLWQLNGVETQPRTVQTGYYDSVIVRTDEGWKFLERRVRLAGQFEVAEVYPELNL